MTRKNFTEASVLRAAAALADGDPLADGSYGTEDYVAMVRAVIVALTEEKS